MQGHGLSPLPKETNDAQLFAQASMLRVKQINGLNFATALPTSSAPLSHSATRPVFHEIPRAAGPRQQIKTESQDAWSIRKPTTRDLQSCCGYAALWPQMNFGACQK
jgi:hypothetical protein